MSGNAAAEVSLEPVEGWHCSHLYYRFDRGVIARLSGDEIRRGREQFIAALDPAAEVEPLPMQLTVQEQRALIDYVRSLLRPAGNR